MAARDFHLMSGLRQPAGKATPAESQTHIERGTNCAYQPFRRGSRGSRIDDDRPATHVKLPTITHAVLIACPEDAPFFSPETRAGKHEGLIELAISGARFTRMTTVLDSRGNHLPLLISGQRLERQLTTGRIQIDTEQMDQLFGCG